MEDKHWNIEKLAAWVVLILGGGYLFLFFLRELLPLFLPFLFAWGLAFPVRAVASFLNKRLKIPYKLSAGFLILSLLFFLVFLAAWLTGRLIDESGRLLKYLMDNPEIIDGFFDNIKAFFREYFSFLPTLGDGEGGTLTGIFTALLEKSLTFFSNALAGFLRSLPGVIFTFAVSVIAALYFAMDLTEINAAVKSRLPKAGTKVMQSLKSGAVKTSLCYLRSFSIIFVMNTVLLFLGLWILGIEYALFLAFLFAVLDLLPVIGIGITLVPWGIYSLATGNLYLGAGLLILYALITLLRQFIEPRLIGGSIGLHPLVTLFSMVVGAGFLGLFGMLLGPLTAVAVKGALDRSLFKNEKKAAPNKEKTGG